MRRSRYPVSSGLRDQRVQLANASAPVPDGDGGFMQTVTPLSPAAVDAAVRTATAHDATLHGTTLALADAVLTIPYHPQVSIQTVVTLQARTLYVANVRDPDERHVESVLYCRERAV